MLSVVVVVVAALACGAEAQFTHLQNLQQPHLPQDPALLLATQQFLQEFQARAGQAAAATTQSGPNPHQRVSFLSSPPSAAPAPTTPSSFSSFLPEEPINAAIRHLHQTLKPREDVNNQGQQQFQQFQQPQQQFEQQQQQHAPSNQFQQQNNQFQQHNNQNNQKLFTANNNNQQAFHPNHISPVTNQFGHVINPNRFPGPLADDIPASVGGPLLPVGPTAAVHQAQQELAQAHMAILAHHATLPKTPAPEKKEKTKKN